MASPDVSTYVDLTLYDTTAADLADRAASDAQTKLPEAKLPVGSLEMVLIEALALIVAELAFALNRVPGAVLESLLAGVYGIARSPGVAATTTVKFTAAATGASIPQGTLVQLAVGEELVQFSTNVELTILAGTATGTVAATATTLSALPNGVAAGTPVEVVTATVGVTAAQLDTAVTGGADPEDGDTYLSRASTRLARLTDTLVMPAHFEARALEDPGVYRAKVVDNYNPNAGSGVPGDHGGHVTVAVLGPTGAMLSAAAKTTLQNAMDAAAAANLAVYVVDPTITVVAVTATVHKKVGADSATVQAACVAALDNFLSPLTWGWGATVRRNDLIALLEGVKGVDYVDAGHPTAPAGDVALAGVAPLADAGVLTITVV